VSPPQVIEGLKEGHAELAEACGQALAINSNAYAHKIISLIISYLSFTDKTVSPLFPTQFPKFEYTAAMRRNQFFEILNL